MRKIVSHNSLPFVKLGFSLDEARVYEILIKEGPTSVKALSKKVKVLPNALYRLLIKLIQKGLISSTGKHPAIYRAISPSIAFDGFIKAKQSELETIKENVINQLTQKTESDQTRIDMLKSTYEFFLTYVELSKMATKEILIISIGEPVPEEVLLANRDAMERGIKIRFIVHKNDNSNQELLKRWQKMGLEVKHYPDWGFHLVIFDKIKSILSVNNPDDTSNRTALVIYSQGLAKAHSDYFYSVWKKAKKI